MVATLVLEASALKACQFESDPEHHIKAHFSRPPVMDSSLFSTVSEVCFYMDVELF